MMYTSNQPITVDGVRLDTFAWNVESKSGRDYIPGVRGSNIQAPGRHGSIPTKGKKFEDGKMILQMWVVGCDPDGNVPTSSYNEFRKNMDKLKLLFSKRSGLLDIRKTDTLGVVRQAYGEVLAAVDPEVMGIDPLGKFSVEISLPAVFWADLTDSDYDSTAGGVNSASIAVTLPAFLGATAIMEDLQIVVDGPATNPRVTDNATGHYVQLNEALPAGSQWVVNTSTWQSKVGVGIAFTTSGTDKTAVTSFSGQHTPRYFALTPNETAISVQFSNGGGTTSATRLRIRGKRKYL